VAQSGDGIVSACVSQIGGKLRIVEPGEPCKRRERALGWAVAGPQGPPGQKGDPGPSGGGGTVAYDDLCATKPLDKASPQLFQSTLAGTVHPTAKLEVLAADGITVGIVYDLTSVILSSLTYGAPVDCSSRSLSRPPA